MLLSGGRIVFCPEKGFRRVRELSQHRERSPADVLDGKPVLAQQNIAAQEAQLRVLNQQKDYQTVVAPFDGVVTQRNIDVGSLVQADATTGTFMFTVMQTDVIRTFVYVPQDQAVGVEPGVEAVIHIPELPGRSFPGKVTRIADGRTRDVATVSAPQVFTGNASWAPDGRSLMVNTFWANSDRRETWLIPVDGGAHKVLDLPGQSWGRIRVHPDGKRVAYHAGNLKTEVWVLENFLPGR